MDRIAQRLKSTLSSALAAPSLLQLGGNLSILPIELAFDILDELFLGTGHAGLCALRSLSLTSQFTFQTVSTYLQRMIPSEYLHNTRWVPYPEEEDDPTAADLEIEIVPIDASPETGLDIITSTILDDCPQCFDWLCKEFPGLDCESCNQHGWSFAAIAAHACSARMFKHFLRKTNGAYGSFFPLIADKANPFAAESDTPWTILIEHRDLSKFEQCFDMIEPVLLKANTLWEDFQGQIGSVMFDPEELLTLCTFASISLAQRFEALGTPLYNITQGTGTPWHAAVLNGPEFLSYIHEHTDTLPISRDFQGDTPLQVAIRSGRVDSVLWLSKYDEAQNWRWDPFYPGALEVACQLTSPESILCLEILLPKFLLWKMDAFMTAYLLRTIADETWEESCAQAVRGDIDQTAYQDIRDRLEDRAIRKTELILQNSNINLFLEIRLDRSQRRFVRRTQEYRMFRQARSRAWLGGFGGLAWAMQKPRS